jgi:hypothetical protein
MKIDMALAPARQDCESFRRPADCCSTSGSHHCLRGLAAFGAEENEDEAVKWASQREAV